MTPYFPGATVRRVEAGDARLYLEELGAGSPLLLLHGWPLDARCFTPQLAPLAQRHRVLVCDRRGFGRSRGTPDLQRETGDLLRVLDALAIDRIHLLGMSQGGRVALRFAVVHGDRLHSLVLQGAAVDGLDLEDGAVDRLPIERYRALARRGDLDRLRQDWLDHPMMQVPRSRSDLRGLLADQLAGYDARDLLTTAAAPPPPVDVASRLPGLALPVLLLTGALESQARRATASWLRDHLPCAREVVLPGAGHLCNLVAAEGYNQTLLAFLDAVDRTAAAH